MSYVLSLLDKGPVAEGEAVEDALACTVALAKRAEKLGYHRFWLAEHHDTARMASAAPEILVSHILAQTARIRVGTGGVMLQHYAPYKVAETFNVLSALAPGRVDLGIGKAPGGLPLSTRALRWRHGDEPEGGDNFTDKLELLNGFLDGALPAGHPLDGVSATPRPARGAERHLLGASTDSAALAARLGWSFVYAGHFNSDPAVLARSFETYAQGSGGRRPLLALAVLVAETEEEARNRADALRMFRVTLRSGRAVNVGSAAQAAEFARQAGESDYTVEERRPTVLAGTARQVHAELAQLSDRHGIDEFVLDLPVPDAATRLNTIELLARGPIAVAA